MRHPFVNEPLPNVVVCHRFGGYPMDDFYLSQPSNSTVGEQIVRIACPQYAGAGKR